MHLQHVRRPGVQVRVQVLLQRPQELQILALQGPRRGVARRVGLPAPGHAVHDHPHRQHRLQPLRRHAARPLPRERQPPACRWERRRSGGARASVSTLRPRRTLVAGGGHTAVTVGAGGRPRDPRGDEAGGSCPPPARGRGSTRTHSSARNRARAAPSNGSASTAACSATSSPCGSGSGRGGAPATSAPAIGCFGASPRHPTEIGLEGLAGGGVGCLGVFWEQRVSWVNWAAVGGGEEKGALPMGAIGFPAQLARDGFLSLRTPPGVRRFVFFGARCGHREP